jgi:hypothetical protein
MEKFVSGIRVKHPGSAVPQYHGTPLKKEVKTNSVSTPTIGYESICVMSYESEKWFIYLMRLSL